MAIKKNLMKTPIKPDPMGLEELRFNLGLSDLIGKENPQFQVANGIKKSPTRDKTNDGPLPILFSILKIYPVFDPCKSGGRDVIPRSVGARGTMSINKYLPYPTYIHLGDL